jgi:hypothetical protein
MSQKQNCRARCCMRRRAILAGAMLLVGTPLCTGQQEPKAPETASVGDPAALLKEFQAMRAEMTSLRREVRELRERQEAAEKQADQLRAALSKANVQLRTKQTDVADTTAVSAAEGAVKQEETLADRVVTVEEDQQLADGKLADLNQTKVESGSRYRLRLSGIVLFSLFGNIGTVDNIDYPQVAEEQSFLLSNHSMGASIRQSQVNLEGTGPQIGGARTSADLSFDFAAGIPQVPNGVSFGVLRLRTGVVRFDWTNSSVVAGQDTLFIAPLQPTSLAQMAIPPMAYSGNLWSWTPQVQVEHNFKVGDDSSVRVTGGVLDSFSGDIPPEPYNRTPTWGETTGQPAYATHVSWRQKVGPQFVQVGGGAYYGRQEWGYGRSVDSWAGTIDLVVPLSTKLGFSGAYYRGRALGGLGGGIGQSVLWNGSLADGTTQVYGLDSEGGWLQLKFRATPKLQINAAFGQDNPFASELRQHGGNLHYYDDVYSRNRSFFGNVIFNPRSNVAISFEYRHLATTVLDAETNTANLMNLTLGYTF